MTILLLGIGIFYQAKAQEVLTKVNGGTSWEILAVNGTTTFSTNTFTATSNNSHTMGTTDYILFVDASASSATINLPNPTNCIGRVYRFVKTSQSNSLVFNYSIKLRPNRSRRNINGNNIKLTIVSDGTNWWKLEN